MFNPDNIGGGYALQTLATSNGRIMRGTHLTREQILGFKNAQRLEAAKFIEVYPKPPVAPQSTAPPPQVDQRGKLQLPRRP